MLMLDSYREKVAFLGLCDCNLKLQGRSMGKELIGDLVIFGLVWLYLLA